MVVSLDGWVMWLRFGWMDDVVRSFDGCVMWLEVWMDWQGAWKFGWMGDMSGIWMDALVGVDKVDVDELWVGF